MIPLIFTNDDVGISTDKIHIDWFNEVIDLLEERKIKGTFFWVPKSDGIPGYKRKEWMDALKKAIALGHDIQLHGLTHDCLGFGLPQTSFREENKTAFSLYDADPDRYQKEWTIPKLKVKIEEAIDIYRKAFEESPLIFRAPCVGASDAMYVSLKESGINHSSSRIINPKSWLYTMGYNPVYRVWETEFSPYPYTVFGVREYLIMSDYIHKAKLEEHYDDLLSLAKRDYAHLIKEGREVGIMLSHYHSMHKNWEMTKKFYHALFDVLEEKGVNFVTFKEYILKKENARELEAR